MTLMKKEVYASARFKIGDWVRLKGKNPWKGWFRAKKLYEVMQMSGRHIMLRDDDGTESYIDHSYFVKCTDGRPMPDCDAKVMEYEEAMAAQELMEHADE